MHVSTAEEALAFLPNWPAVEPCACEECGCRAMHELLARVTAAAAADPSEAGNEFRRLQAQVRASVRFVLRAARTGARPPRG